MGHGVLGLVQSATPGVAAPGYGQDGAVVDVFQISWAKRSFSGLFLMFPVRFSVACRFLKDVHLST
jgi:hypothetical protein